MVADLMDDTDQSDACALCKDRRGTFSCDCKSIALKKRQIQLMEPMIEEMKKQFW